jgi:hypothetical protein
MFTFQIFGQFHKKTLRTNVNLVKTISVEDMSCVKNILHQVVKIAIENDVEKTATFLNCLQKVNAFPKHIFYSLFENGVICQSLT